MKHLTATITALLLLPQFAFAQAKQTMPEQPRGWTLIATGKVTTGTLISKKPDNSSIVVKLEDGREVTVKTDALAPGDRDYVTKWTAPEPVSKGIVLAQLSVLSQGTGGKSRVITDLQSVIKDYGSPENDTAPHPEVMVYKGPAPYDGGPMIEIPYLMHSDKAAALLMKRPGISSRSNALAPGFPPGMLMREYDIRFGVFNRLFILTDQIDQVVAVQIKSENGDSQDFPKIDWKPAIMPLNSTSDFIVPKTDGARRVTVGDFRKSHKFIAIDLEARGETILYMPEPLIRLSLFHMSKDQRNRGLQQGDSTQTLLPTNSEWDGSVRVVNGADIYQHPASAKIVESHSDGFTLNARFLDRNWLYKVNKVGNLLQISYAENLAGVGINPGVKKLESSKVEITKGNNGPLLRLNSVRKEGNVSIDATYELKLK